MKNYYINPYSEPRMAPLRVESAFSDGPIKRFIKQPKKKADKSKKAKRKARLKSIKRNR